MLGGKHSKINATIEDEIRALALSGTPYLKIIDWLKRTHGIEASKAAISRAVQASATRAGQVLYQTETTVKIVEVESGPEVDDDAVCALYRNELLKEMQKAKKERDDGQISSQEWRGTLIQLAKASNDVIKTRKILRAPDRVTGPQTPSQPEQQPVAEVIFGAAQA